MKGNIFITIEISEFNLGHIFKDIINIHFRKLYNTCVNKK